MLACLAAPNLGGEFLPTGFHPPASDGYFESKSDIAAKQAGLNIAEYIAPAYAMPA